MKKFLIAIGLMAIAAVPVQAFEVEIFAPPIVVAPPVVIEEGPYYSYEPYVSLTGTGVVGTSTVGIMSADTTGTTTAVKS